MIGLSISKCVLDIVRGTVAIDQVTKIISARKAADEKAINDLIARCRLDFWKENPDKAEEIFRQLYVDGKIYMPLLEGESCPRAGRVRWIEDEEELTITWVTVKQ